MVQILLAVLSAIGVAAKNAWTFVKAKALILWAFVSVVLPKVFLVWKNFRLLRLACAGFVLYAIYRVIHDAVLAITVAVDLATGISSLIDSLGWASWIMWDGPLQGSVLWDQLLACVSFRISLQVVAFTLTKIGWFRSNVLQGGLGPRAS